MGRPSIFSPKDGNRYQGRVTVRGAVLFEEARHRLARLVDWDVKRVSDSDVFEYLARGIVETMRYLGRRK